MKLTACTLNLWKTKRWPDREQALAELLRRHRPDLLGVQELRPEHVPVIERALPHHDHVSEWTTHGSIFWDRRKLGCDRHGEVDVGLHEGGSLYWVKLAAEAHRLMVATVHLDWPGIEQERATGRNVRIEQIGRTGEALEELRDPDESVLLLADLNDSTHAIWILEDRFGYADVYGALGRKPRPTYPATDAEPGTPQVVDWIFSRGELSPTMVDTIDLLVDRIAPSDHRAVMACFTLGE